jgi:probable HAF family extracellular repeat protein
MSSRKSTLTLITVLAMTVQANAQQPRPRYTVTDLGVFGTGNNSAAYGVNDSGWVAGSSNLVPNGLQHAFIWYGYGPLIDLGTLGGPSSSVGAGPNAFGEVTVASATSKTDPNDEEFCPSLVPQGIQCLAAVWKDGRLRALPTLPGGNNSQSYSLNNLGQVSGFSENGTRDATCATGTPYQVLRFDGVIWEPSGEIRRLRPLEGDTVGIAWGINDNGQAVGGSGLCSNIALPPAAPAAPHAVLWDSDGTPQDLGHLEGVPPGVYNLANAINGRAEVVGTAQASDGTFHGFLWTKETGMQDIGGFPGAVNGTIVPCCNSINNRGEIVGFSLDANFNSRALVWHDKRPVDLNTLIPADSPLYLVNTTALDDSGQITGFAVVKSSCPVTTPPAWLANQSTCSVVHAFLATPIHHRW